DISFQSQLSLTASQIADLRLAASQLTGPKRRAFEAEMTLKYCAGNPLKAEAVLGWGRHTVALGLAEKRSGIICLGAQSALGVALKLTPAIWSRPGFYRVFGAVRVSRFENFKICPNLKNTRAIPNVEGLV